MPVHADFLFAARTFRFEAWDQIDDPTKEFIRANIERVAPLLPTPDGEVLFELFGVSVPNGFKGLPQPLKSDTARERAAYVRSCGQRNRLPAHETSTAAPGF